LYVVCGLVFAGCGDKLEEPSDVEVDASMVTVLIPAKNEKYEAMKHTVENINKQTVVPEIWILLDEKDCETVEQARKVEMEYRNVHVKVYGNSSKADALNKAAKMISTEYVLIMDVGDVFENRDAIENLLKVAEKGYDAVVSVMKAQKTDKWWKRMVHTEMYNWTKSVLATIKRRFKFIPLPGTGLLVRTEALRRNPFPETLAEDAALGLKITNSAVTDKAILLYNLPANIKSHLKQRARWMAGYLQNIWLAKGLKKLVFISPLVQGLVPVSVVCIPLVNGLYSFPLTIVDWVASIMLLYFILKFFASTLDRRVLLIPLWWVVVGTGFFLAVYYAIKGKWYFSPKDV
jgi:cellulose synthase/poly-beta-1,6-N-acetylglucosamine synthase-like glycosyltransferase